MKNNFLFLYFNAKSFNDYFTLNINCPKKAKENEIVNCNINLVNKKYIEYLSFDISSSNLVIKNVESLNNSILLDNNSLEIRNLNPGSYDLAKIKAKVIPYVNYSNITLKNINYSIDNLTYYEMDVSNSININLSYLTSRDFICYFGLLIILILIICKIFKKK